MRKARYDLKQAICKNSSCIGHSSNVARPGYWLIWQESGHENVGRVLGRIAETDGPNDCKGYLAVIRLHLGGQSAGIRWVNPQHVTEVYAAPPQALLAWLTSPDWVGSKHDIHHIIAMGEHGTLQEQFIATRHDPDKAYNARPEYVAQFILKGQGDLITFTETKAYLETLPLAQALWWFIENQGQDDPITSEVFFYLRERVRTSPTD